MRTAKATPHKPHTEGRTRRLWVQVFVSDTLLSHRAALGFEKVINSTKEGSNPGKWVARRLNA
jgi:hypothetical protein